MRHLLLTALLLSTAPLSAQEVHVSVPDTATWQDRVEVTISGEYCGFSGLGEPVVQGHEIVLAIQDICAVISPAIPQPFEATAELPRLFPGFYTVRVLAPQIPTGEVEIPLGIHETSELVVDVPPAVRAGHRFPITILGRGCFQRGPEPAASDGLIEIPVTLICDFGGIPLGGGIFEETIEIGPYPPGDYEVRILGVADGDIPHLATGELRSYREDGCLPTETELCLHLGRFSVDVEWSTGARQEEGKAVHHVADDTGFFWFFKPSNLEVMLKVLDGCAINGHYWVFGAATTDVEYTLRVTDEATGRILPFGHPGGPLASPFADVTAFPCGL